MKAVHGSVTGGAARPNCDKRRWQDVIYKVE